MARTGGDEFIFILNAVINADSDAIVAKKIVQSMSKPFMNQGHTCLVSSSVGIAIFPNDSNEMETLITLSDDAMYKAKERGKNNYYFSSDKSL